MIDAATVREVVSAIPREAWSPTLIVLALLAALRWLAPVRQQALPEKGSENGHKDGLHKKLDRLDAKLDIHDAKLDRMEERQERLERKLDGVDQRVQKLEGEAPNIVLNLASRIATARAELGLAPTELLPAEKTEQGRKVR